MADLSMTDTRAALLRAIAAYKVWEEWYNDEPGEITHDEYPGRRTRVTRKVRVMKLAGWCQTSPNDVDLHTRGIELTETGRKLLVDLNAKEANRG